MSREILDADEVMWAYRKRCDGVPLAAIGKALYCDPITIVRAFNRHNLRVVNKLEYKRGGTMSEFEKKVVEDLRRNARRCGVWDPGKENMQVAADLIETVCVRQAIVYAVACGGFHHATYPVFE